jgi:hypothetical protein
MVSPRLLKILWRAGAKIEVIFRWEGLLFNQGLNDAPNALRDTREPGGSIMFQLSNYRK